MTNTQAQEAIRQLRESYMRTQDASDVDGCVSHWDDDDVLLPPNEPAVKGKEALRSWYQSIFDEFRIAFKVSFDEIQVTGSWSFARGAYSGRLIPTGGGEPIEEEGKYLEIHRQQLDGSWKFACHMWNSDRSH